MEANKIPELLQFLSIISLGPVLAYLMYLGSGRLLEKVSPSSAIYSLIYGAFGCALSVLLIENLVRELFEVTSIGYFKVGIQGKDILLFAPTIFFFPFVEEALKVIGVTKLLSSSERYSERQVVVLGFFSGIGFSSSINLVKATILFTQNELTTWFLPQLLESLSHIIVHSGTTSLLSYFLSRTILGEGSIMTLLKTYVLLTLIHVVYQLILALRAVASVYTEVYLAAFVILFSLTLAAFLRRRHF